MDFRKHQDTVTRSSLVWTFISSVRGPEARAVDGLDRKGLKE